MNLLEIIESLLQRYNNSSYNEFWSVCQKIVADTTQHNKLITTQMSNYDLHDETHSEQVIYIIENLLGDRINELTCYEAMLLYLSAYLHDSAMALPSWEYDLLKAVEGTDEIYDNTLEFRIGNDFKPEHSYSEAIKLVTEHKTKLFEFDKAKAFVFAKESETKLIESLARLMREYEQFRNGYHTELTANKHSVAKYINSSKLIRSEFIRITHHTRVVDNVQSLKHKVEDVLNGFAANNFIQDLASICKCHGEPVSAIFNLPIEREDLFGEKSNIQFVAMMLRLGDVIHFSSDRAPLSLFAEKKITDETSFLHWKAKFQDLKFKFDVLNGVVTISYTAYCSNPEVYYFIQDYMNWVDNELDNYFVLKQRWEQFKIDKLENYSIPISNRVNRSQLKYDKEVFIPQPNMHFSLNQSKILELLMGVQLYKDEYLCIRELYQNSLDATKCIIAINKLNGVQEDLSIEFGIGEEMVEGVKRGYLYCLDHGTGMNEYIINNFLLHIGNSYYKSKEFHRKNTGWGFDVNPTSQFGIGILSSYMMADKIGITTVHYEHNEIKSFILEGVNEHFYYINAPELDIERIGQHGTIVKLYLKDEFSHINNQYIDKLPIILGNSESDIKNYVDKKVFLGNLSCILSKHICIAPDTIAVNVRCDDNQIRSIIQCNKIMDIHNYPSITRDDLKHFWSDIHFLNGAPNPYLEVIERLDLIENYNLTVKTKNLELYSHISLPKNGMDKDNLYYYLLFRFVGQKEGSILVDGIKVESGSHFDNNVSATLEYDFSSSAILNFVGKERPVLSIDRKTCVSMPPVDSEIEEIKAKFIEQLASTICSHIEKENIKTTDKLFSIILNIAVKDFPSFADKLLVLLCETSLGNAPVPESFNMDTQITICELIKSAEFSLSNIDFRKYKEVYRRILIGKLINVGSIHVNDSSMLVYDSQYSALPMERYRIYEEDYSLSSVAIKADKWEGAFREYDMASNLWPLINPRLFDVLNDEGSVINISSHCKVLSEAGNGIHGIARLNPTLINPAYGIGLDHKDPFKKGACLLSNPDSIAKNFWLFELTNHKIDTFEQNKGASLFAFIAPRDLTDEETLRLKELELSDPNFAKGVKEGWSILFLSNEEYVIEPGVVSKSYIISKIPESVKSKNPEITYYNTDGSVLF